jgi:hypothetical protein
MAKYLKQVIRRWLLPNDHEGRRLRMKLRIALLGILCLLAVVLCGGISNNNQTLAAEFSCQQGATCPNPSKCTGDHFVQSGCTYTCYKDSGVPGQIVFSGSANCGTTQGGTGGGGTGGGGGGESGGCWSDWDCYAGESCEGGMCVEYGGGGHGGLLP